MGVAALKMFENVNKLRKTKDRKQGRIYQYI